MQAMSKIIGDSACPRCKEQGRDSHNNHLIHFENGNKFCNRCGYKEVADRFKSHTSNYDIEGGVMTPLHSVNALQSLTVSSRGISSDTTSHYGVKVEVNTANREPLAVYFPYHKFGKVVGYKKRLLDEKTFMTIGEMKSPELFGQHLAGNGGKLLIVTEGEFDCLAVHQMLKEAGKSYRVVSLPQGANKKAFEQHLEWLEKFEKVVLWFDNDEAGNKAAKECASILSAGKAFTLSSPLGIKDANDCLMSGQCDIMKLLMSAKPFRQDGIVSASEVMDVIKHGGMPKAIARYPFADLDKMLHGIRSSELIVISAGSGMGKSQFLREVAYSLYQTTYYNIGLMFMEESLIRTATSLAGLAVDKPLHLLPDTSQDELEKAMDKVFSNERFYLFDHFGSSDVDYILGKIRYMAKGLGCKFIILDHLSIIVSAGSDMDERKLIDSLMTKLRTLVQECDITVFAVSHLKRPEGNKGHEDGVQTSLGHLRGSAAIAQLSDAVIGLERNQQAESEEERNTTKVRVLKNRFSGETGLAGKLSYDRLTGRLIEKQEWE